MTEIYVILKETSYINRETNEIVGYYKSTETKVENRFDIPLVFSSVENARNYLEMKGLKEIAFLNYQTDKQSIDDGLAFYHITKYTIKSVTVS